MLTYSTECRHWTNSIHTLHNVLCLLERDVISEVFNTVLFIVNIFVDALQLKQ